MTYRSTLLLGLLLLWGLHPCQARAQTPDTLRDEVLALDHALFAAFNEGRLDVVMGFFADDVEFLHDQDGRLGWDDVQTGFRSLFAQDNGLHRELVRGSTEVHPVPGYGAIQVGEHRFCHDEGGRQDCGVFEFTHVWRRAGDRWQITRVLSYGH